MGEWRWWWGKGFGSEGSGEIFETEWGRGSSSEVGTGVVEKRLVGIGYVREWIGLGVGRRVCKWDGGRWTRTEKRNMEGRVQKNEEKRKERYGWEIK